MPDETETQEAPKAAPSKPAKAALPKPARPSMPQPVRAAPQPGRPHPSAPPKKPAQTPREGTIERHLFDHAQEGAPVPRWKHAAAKAMHRWPNGAEISREDYDAAIKKAETITVR